MLRVFFTATHQKTQIVQGKHKVVGGAKTSFQKTTAATVRKKHTGHFKLCYCAENLSSWTAGGLLCMRHVRHESYAVVTDPQIWYF